jgi:hypothetical protein
MSLVRPPGLSPGATPGEFLSFLLAYMELLVARWAASDSRRDPRRHAVPLKCFRAKGIGEPVLLWMIYQAHVEHLRAVPRSARGRPKPQAVDSLRIGEASAFSLTEAGEAFAERFLDDVLVPAENGAFRAAWDLLFLGPLPPHYDKEDRVFAWGRHVLKCFRQPSVNQELVLRAAQEQGWPVWFDDPLPRVSGTNPKTRLHDTTKDLNRRQAESLIHFKGDGSGRRIGWEYW